MTNKLSLATFQDALNKEIDEIQEAKKDLDEHAEEIENDEDHTHDNDDNPNRFNTSIGGVSFEEFTV